MSDVDFLNNIKKDNEDIEKDEKGDKSKNIEWSEVDKKKAVEKKGENKEKKNIASSDDISSWLKSLKDEKGVEGKGAKELKTSKEALGEYQKVLRKSKKAAAMKEGVEKIKEKGEIKTKKEGGIADIIKRKLSFGSKDKDEVTVKTNLIKSEGVTYFDWKEKTKVLVINLLLTFVILGIGYGYLEYRETGVTQKSEGLNEEINRLKEEITLLEGEAEVVDDFQKKVEIVDELLEKHIYWTNLFDFLEDNLLSDVYLDSDFVGNVDGEFNLSSVGKNFTDITNQSRVMRQSDKVINLSVDSGEAIAGEEGRQEVEFSLFIKFDPEIFYK